MKHRIYRLVIAMIVPIVIVSCTHSKTELQPDELIGVWSGLLFQTESEFDSIEVIPLTNPEKLIFRQGQEQTVYRLTNSGQVYQFDNHAGLRFDATLSPEGQQLNGVLTNGYDAQSLSFQQKADRWLAKVVKPELIDTDYQVYLEFYHDENKQLQAKILSNKENRKLHFTIDAVRISGNDIDFDITNNRFAISATYQAEQNQVLLNYGNPGSQRTINLSRLDPNQLTGYKPRASNTPYVYRVPAPVDPSIQTASLTDVGLDLSLLNFMDEINNGDYEQIHSVIISKDNKLVFEEYFHGYHRDSLQDIRSAFKSIASLLVGKAMMGDPDLTVESKILDYYPEYQIGDQAKKKISVLHALTMSSGIENEDEDKMQWENNDWVKYKLEHSMKTNPGEKYVYSDGGINLLSGVIEQSTEQYLPSFLQTELLAPMGIEQFQMLVSPVGRGYLAGNFYLRPIDFSKFGLLILNKGRWGSEQLISESWIAESTRAHIKPDWPKNADYGFLWRLLERPVGDKQVKTIEAWGNGGQYLIIIPELDMTVTFTSGNYNLFPEMERPFKILNQFILPAVKP